MTESAWTPPPRLLLALYAIIFILLHALDLVLTLAVISNGGQELNPLPRAVLALGATPFIVYKLGFAAAITGLLAFLARRSKTFGQAAWRILIVSIFLLLGVVVWNFLVLYDAVPFL
ncbi:MAG: DUF5658 family protein [Patescibacteria group bacterium]|nr:MAG: DUF5658 family protein [Patescibacteria group bacterium]